MIKKVKNYLLIFIGLFISLLPFKASASGEPYEVGFKFYKVDASFDASNSTAAEDWFYDVFQADEAEELDANSTLKQGDYFVVATTLKTIDASSANAMAFALYYRYDSSIVEVLDSSIFFDGRIERNGGIFPARTWNYDTLRINNVGEVTATFRDTKSESPTNFSNTTGGAAVVAFFKVKDTASSASPIRFTWITESNAGSDGLYSTGSTNDSAHVNLKTVDSSSLSVFEEKSSDATLSSLSVSNSSTNYILNPSFIAGGTTTSFSTVVPANIDKININATATHAKASVTGIGEKSLNVGDNSFLFTITAEDGTVKTYTMNIKRLSDSAYLNSLSLSSISLNEPFNKETYNYTATVPYKVSNTTVNASVASPALIKSGTGSWNLSDTGATLNNKSIIVEAENCDALYSSVPGNSCTTNTYSISVKRELPKSDATLNDIKVNGTSISNFSSLNTEYTLDPVKNNITSLNIVASLNDVDASYVVSGNNLSVGDNTISITVTAEDGTTQKIYSLKIRRQSNNADISSLTLTSTPQGTLSPIFSSSTTSYKYIYDESVTSVNVQATLSDTLFASITGTGDYDLSTNSSANIVVTAEDGTVKTYTIVFERKKSSVNTLSSLTVKNGSNNYSLDPVFNKDVTSYTVEVPNDIDKVTIGGTSTSQNIKSITGFGEVSLNFGSNQQNIVVIAEDGTVKTYIITINRKKSDDAYLKDIKINNVSINDFSKENFEYNIDPVGSSTSSLNITYDKNNEYSTVEILDNNLSVGNNTVKLKVTSQDGNVVNIYKINVRRKSNNSNLAGITVTSNPQGTLVEAFNPNTTVYTYKYDRSVTSINVSALASDSNQVITGEGTYNILDTKKAVLTVTPEDGNVKIYTVNFEQILESDSTLSSITVSKDSDIYVLSPAFNSNTLEYSVEVPTEIDQVNINAVANGNYAKSITGTGNVSLNFGSNIVKIIVTAEDSSTTTYKLNINRKISTDASLTDLKVDGTTINNFKSEKTEYTLDDVDYAKDEIEISATGIVGSTISGDGVKNLKVGDNTFEVTVTAQDGVTKSIYKINVRRKSNDSSLTSLSSSIGTLSPTFSPTILTYKLQIADEVDKLTINAIPASGAKIQNASSLTDIDVKNNSSISIDVLAEDSNYTTTYTINIERLASTNAYLKDLTVSSGILSPSFNKNTFEYTVNVGENVSSIEIGAIKENDKSIITGNIGVNNLNYGNNNFSIKVTAEDNKTSNVYKLNVIRAKKSDNTLKELNIDGNLIDGFNKFKTDYEINVSYSQNTIEIDATANDSNATVTGDIGIKNLNIGINNFTINVKAQNGDIKTYTIKVTRDGNSDNSLKSLSIFGITPTWNESSKQYELTVGNDKSVLSPSDIVATIPDGAIINKGTGMNLSVGNNIYTISVTSGTGDVQNYRIVINREEKELSSDATLASLSVKDYTLSPSFNKNTLLYSIGDVESSVGTLTVNATPSDIKASIKYYLNGIEQSSNVMSISKSGASTIKVKVIAENKDEKDYLITYNKLQQVPSKIISSIHTIDDNYIRSVKLNETALSLKNELTNDNQYLEIWTADESKKVADDEKLATGMIVKLVINGVEEDRKIIVIRGDTSGDGEIDLLDAVKILNNALQKSMLEGAYKEAAFVNNDDEIDLLDAVMILNHCLQKQPLY